MLKNLRQITVKKTKWIRAALGAQITGLSLWSLVVYPTHAFDYTKTTSPYVDGSKIEVISTSTTYVYPVVEPIGVSQGYHGLHRGVDIRSPKGTAVVAVDSGMIIEARQETFGYGKHVRVAHSGTRSTLYAHLNEISVSVGQVVTAGEQIGTVGTTGWATGAHLHFEISDGSTTVNPATILR